MFVLMPGPSQNANIKGILLKYNLQMVFKTLTTELFNKR